MPGGSDGRPDAAKKSLCPGGEAPITPLPLPATTGRRSLFEGMKRGRKGCAGGGPGDPMRGFWVDPLGRLDRFGGVALTRQRVARRAAKRPGIHERSAGRDGVADADVLAHLRVRAAPIGRVFGSGCWGLCLRAGGTAVAAIARRPGGWLVWPLRRIGTEVCDPWMRRVETRCGGWWSAQAGGRPFGLAMPGGRVMPQPESEPWVHPLGWAGRGLAGGGMATIKLRV